MFLLGMIAYIGKLTYFTITIHNHLTTDFLYFISNERLTVRKNMVVGYSKILTKNKNF